MRNIKMENDVMEDNNKAIILCWKRSWLHKTSV